MGSTTAVPGNGLDVGGGMGRLANRPEGAAGWIRRLWVSVTTGMPGPKPPTSRMTAPSPADDHTAVTKPASWTGIPWRCWQKRTASFTQLNSAGPGGQAVEFVTVAPVFSGRFELVSCTPHTVETVPTPTPTEPVPDTLIGKEGTTGESGRADDGDMPTGESDPAIVPEGGICSIGATCGM